MSVEIREVSNFNQIRFKGPGTVKIRQTDGKESLTIHAPAYVIKDIESSVKDSVLYLGYVTPPVVSLKVIKEVISFDLRLKNLESLSVSGSGRILIPDLDVDRLRLSLSGSGVLQLDHLTADTLETNLSGSGNMNIEGDVETQRVKISGSGLFNGLRLVSDICYLDLTGSGEARLLVHDQLTVRINGSGRASYRGYPDIRKQISGTGSLSRITRTLAKDQKSPTGGEHE